MYRNSPLISLFEGSVAKWNFGKAFKEQAMRRLSMIAFVGLLAQTMSGCGLRPEDSAEIIAATPFPQVAQAQATAKPFDKPPMVSQNSQKSSISSVPSLIQLTNAKQRTKQVPKGRQDPFAGLFVPAVPSISTSSVPSLPSPRRELAPQPVAIKIRPNPVASSGNLSRRSRLSKVIPLPPPVIPSPIEANPLPLPILPGSEVEPVLPPPPQDPDLARAVVITGVIKVGSEPHAIVRVPSESTSRYVRVGQRLSNGQVLVKRIEINEGSDPVVILEQYGVEVAKAVGESPAKSTQAAVNPDASPVTPPQNTIPASTPDASPVTPPQDNVPNLENQSQ